MPFLLWFSRSLLSRARRFPAARGVDGLPRSGFTLIETIFYIVLFTVLFAVIVQTLLTISGTHQEISAIKQINNGATVALERVTREIRDADHVLTGQSDLGTATGTIALAMDGSADTTRTVRLTDNGTLELLTNGTLEGPLTASAARVSEFRLHHLQNSTTSEAVRVTLGMRASTSDETRTATFRTTAILRDSY